jgi:hypothetical protein
MATSTTFAAEVKPGDLITPENASIVADLVSPGNLVLVRQGLQMKIVPTQRLEWPPPYKTATEKYSPQVRVNDRGELQNYVAGLPFPLLDPNDPQVATKIMWNFSYRPQFTDDAEIRYVEIASSRGGAQSLGPIAHFTIGRFAIYNNVGRTEVPPIPTDPEAKGPGIASRFAAFPFLEPHDIVGTGLIRYRYIDPSREDNAWYFFAGGGAGSFRGVRASDFSDSVIPAVLHPNQTGTFANNIDPNSFFGFAAKIESYNYRLLGIKPMLACVHAENLPAKQCQFDNGRSVCPEDWEIRQLYVVEATVKPRTWHQMIGSDGEVIPRRVLYIDSEGWFITASDQYDKSGALWKTLATFNAYRDRTTPAAKIAVYPFKRIFQTALVDEDIQDGFSSVMYLPGPESGEQDGWYVNKGRMTKDFVTLYQLDWQAYGFP